MMSLRRKVNSVLLCTLLPLGAQAQESFFSIGSDADAYQCLNPNPPKCISLSQDTSQCPGCDSWGTVFLQLSGADFSLDIEAYSYASGLPRANFMVKDAAEQVFELPFPVTAAGDPIKVADLYTNPEEFGWTEIQGGENLPGAVALWPNLGGVIVENGGYTGDDDSETVSYGVLYPSDTYDGALITRPTYTLESLGSPKFVVPEAAIQLEEVGF